MKKVWGLLSNVDTDVIAEINAFPGLPPEYMKKAFASVIENFIKEQGEMYRGPMAVEWEINMNFERTEENGSIILAIDGMIDANTASETDMMIQSCIKQTDDLTLDLKGVEYISSAGLRVILNAENAMEEKGSSLNSRSSMVCLQERAEKENISTRSSP